MTNQNRLSTHRAHGGGALVRVRGVAVAVGVVAVLAGGCGTDAPADSRSGKAVTSTQGKNAVSARRQTPGANRKVVIDEVRLTKPGYAGVYEDGNGSPGRLLGASKLLGKGTHRDVAVKLPKGFADRSVFVVLHTEDTGNTSLDFPSGDAPVSGAQGVVLVNVKLKK